MLRFLSPLILLAFVKSHRLAIKRLMLTVLAYVFLMLVFVDFQEEIFADHIALAKAIKWLIVILSVAHISAIIKHARRHEYKLDQHYQLKAIEGPLLTRSEKIIQRHKLLRDRDV